MAERTLWQEMISEFMKWQSSDEKHNALYRKIREGKATYVDAQDYSKCIAKEWSHLLQKHVGVGADLRGKTNDEVIQAIEMSLKRCYQNSSYYSSKVQEILNESVNIKIKAVEGKVDPTRISNLLEKLKAGEDVSETMLVTLENQWLIEEPVVENISRSAVTDTIEANARLHTDAGLVSYIERKQGPGGCCDWCASVSGRYVYGEQPDDFFKVHKHCNCVITYMPSRGKWQKITYSTNKKGVRSKNTVEL